MRRALAAAGLIGTLAGAGLATGPASAQTPTVTLAQDVDVDEPASKDGDDDTGKYGLIGLTGMLGLFGYRHLRNRRTTGTDPIGVVDTDGSGSRRV